LDGKELYLSDKKMVGTSTILVIVGCLKYIGSKLSTVKDLLKNSGMK
jgi:hypothetical protein